jgi:hypothetical protein
MIADKVFSRLKDYLGPVDKTMISFESMGPQEFFSKDVDAFGNIKYSQEYTQKDLLAEQMLQLEDTAKKLLEEEKYELLTELKEIYEKIKKEYDNL